LTLRDGLLVGDRKTDGERHQLGERELRK